MKRREFLAVAGATVAATAVGRNGLADTQDQECRIYASPAAAMRSPRERLAYVAALYVGSRKDRADYLATVDVDPDSPTYSQVVHRLPMPNIGDELHHYGWNACSSCHGHDGLHRRYLIVPGLRSTRLHIVDTSNPAAPRIHRVIEPDEILSKTDFSAPHTIHCLADGTIMISMLGDAQGNGPGGFLLLDQDFRIVGAWERDKGDMQYNYDFWYQPRHNVMVSSEFAAPNTCFPGFRLEDVEAGKYGQQIHFWNWSERRVEHSEKLGSQGLIPLEVRFHHDPRSTHGYVGAALSTVLWHWHRDDGAWHVDRVVSVPPVEHEDWPFRVPGLMTDLLISMDDRWLYFSNWLHGDIRQYDIRDPGRPKLAGQVWCGGLLGRSAPFRGKPLTGGPQMLQLSLDGKRLYVTNSLLSTWDNRFYPEIADQGSYMLQVDCDTDRGGMTLNENFFVDFGKEPQGAARAHEMRFPGGDCTSDIWM